MVDAESAEPSGLAALLQLSLCMGLLSSNLPLVTSASTWRGTDFASLGLSTEGPISKSTLERVTLPSLSCALG